MSANYQAAYWVSQFKLQPHPEGGYYRETYRSGTHISRAGNAGTTQACTSIYYLLEAGDYSGFHRLKSDEIWYFHKGAPLHIHAIDDAGVYQLHQLSDEDTGSLSLVIPAGCWFAAELSQAEGFALVSCAVAPAFDFNEFEMAKRHTLAALYPQHKALINRLCRE